MVPNVVLFHKMAPKFVEKHRKTLFSGGQTKRGFHDLCGRKFAGKCSTKTFSGKFGGIRAKILRTPANLPAPTPMSYHEDVFC